MMFRTKSGSEYYMDEVNRFIWGGKLGNTPRKYQTAVIISGERAVVTFNDGSQMITSAVDSI